jgi:hypothetical protein
MKAQVVGFKEALRDLNKLDKELSKEIRRDIRKTVKPLVDAINASVPSEAPLSGMAHSGRTGWQNRKKVAVKLDTRKPRRYIGRPGRTITSVVRVTTKDAPTAITDMAGKAGGSGAKSKSPIQYRRPNFSRALTARLAQPSRFMWPTAEDQIPDIEDELKTIIKRVEKIMNRDLQNRYRSVG